jgi:chromosome segregation ATPase
LQISSSNTLTSGANTTDSVEMTQQNNPKEALEKAFELFYEESKKLESQQADLQAKINLLSNELSDSNQRITILLNSMPAGVILLENQRYLIRRLCNFCRF